MDFFFFVGSLYSYPAVMRIGEAARRAGVPVRWRPFNVRAIMLEQNNLPRRNPVKMKYIWRDVERRAARYGLPFRPGLPFPVDPHGLANRAALVAAEEGWGEQYAVEAFRRWFAEHEAPGDPGKMDPRLVARADSEDIRRRFDEETDAARRLGIFGAPTFMVGEEMFWGDDRLDEALEWARKR
jgi:2-hydroxychromene-2-carboxylate isomerase